MLRLSSNCIVIEVAFSALTEVSWVTPGICPNCRSRGAATEAAMVSALVALQRRVHRDRRKIDLRKGRDRQERNGDKSDEADRRHQQRSRHWPLDKWL